MRSRRSGNIVNCFIRLKSLIEKNEIQYSYYFFFFFSEPTDFSKNNHDVNKIKAEYFQFDPESKKKTLVVDQE